MRMRKEAIYVECSEEACDQEVKNNVNIHLSGV
jgi:hypothetical protein